MFAKLLIIPFALMAATGLYLSWEYIEGWTWLIILGVVGGAFMLIFSPQINWWYYHRNPPDVEPEVRHMLERQDNFYNALAPLKKELFRNRMALFMMGTQFMPQGWESVPHDIEAIVAACAVKVRFGQEELLFKTCERVVVYPTSFPSPMHPEEWHSSEWFEEDGVVLFSAKELVRGFFQPTQFLQLAVYEYCRIFRVENPKLSWPEIPDDPWSIIQKISGWDSVVIHQMIGLQSVDPGAVLSTLYFTHFHKMAQVEGRWTEKFEVIFGSTPIIA